MRRVASFFTVLVSLWLTTMVVSGARTTWTLHRQNGRLQTMTLPVFPSPNPRQRLLILSPHPDDETLGCGGLIRQATARGVPVAVAFITNGDAYPMAVERTYRKIPAGPADYVRFGELRQDETRAALRRLGVPRNRIFFLGYPDRGLTSLWMSRWMDGRPYTAPYTRATSNPYPDSLRPGAPYTGQSLTKDLASVISRFHPTDLFFTHPNDDHPDHAVLGCFVLAALQLVRGRTGAAPDSRDPSPEYRLHTYLIHRGDWPVPQGLRPRDRLPPPGAMADLDTHWRALRLSAQDVAAKGRALRAYDSQLHVPPGARFLTSFVRRNELFGEYQMMLTDATRAGGPRISTGWLLSPDPIQDKLSRDFEPSADLEGIGVRRSGDRLQIQVVTRGLVSRWVRYRINVHRLDARESAYPAQISFIASSRAAGSAARCTIRQDLIECDMPLRALGDPTRVVVNAETLVGGIVVDRAAWRGFSLE